MKKRGFGAGRWNGVGGKVDGGKETIEKAMIRETREEIDVKIKNFYKIAELKFTFPHNKNWNQIVHTYFATSWGGKIRESEEMKPKWFSPYNLPFNLMWPDDIYWLPKVLNNKFIKAEFTFGKDDMILKKKIRSVRNLF